MRLTSIKLAGFKSFVDSTQVVFRSNLTAVVGPNGCGKSNVIDAVRWVMGEGSAKTLRASAMTDVIFNGSTQRQPVGKASIELVFDNSDQSLQGEYGKFSEISVRREVTRDAQSFYYLNGTRCRRRDITDLFLGTGLGPRSYAIIEQGMINRFIEARPEELRAYIEEAAGVSRYKERRRETESRLKRTRENLDRLGDLEEELNRQLQHLRRQAEAAKRFQTLSADIRQAEVRLAGRRWASSQSLIDAATAKAREFESQINDALVHRESVAGQIEAQRQSFDEGQQALEQAQADYYSAGAEVTRLEQQQRSWQDQRRAIEQTQARARTRLQSAQQSLANDDQESQRQQAQVTQWQQALTEAQAAGAGLQASVEQAEHTWRQARQAQQADQQARSQVEQSLRLAERDREQAERQVGQIQARRQRLAANRPVAPEVESFDASALTQGLAQYQEERIQVQAQLTQAEQAEQAWQTELRDAQSQAQAIDAELRTLDQALASSTEVSIPGLPRLLDDLAVPQAQAVAFSSALGALTQAYRLDDWDSAHTAGQFVVQAPQDWQSLLALTGGRLVDTLEQAIAEQSSLQPGQFLVLPEGQKVGRGWMVLSPQVDPAPQLAAQRAEAERQRSHVSDHLETLQSQQPASPGALKQRLVELDTRCNDTQREIDRMQSEQAASQRLMSEFERSLERFESDMAAIEEDSESAHLALEDAIEAKEAATEALSALPDPGQEVETLEAQWNAARDDWEDHQTGLSSLTLKLQTAQARLDSLSERLSRGRQDVEEATDALADVQQQLDEGADAQDIQQQLNQAIAQRVTAEQTLTQAREAMQGFDAQVRALEHDRQATEQRLEQLREQLAQARSEAATQAALQQSQSEFLEGAGFVPSAVAETLDDASETQLMVIVERLEKQRERTGAVNLAAVDELAQAEERQAYYAAQRLDLETALATLDSAIRKIDRETRALFRETFDRVNQSLQGLFPKVFGGGEAWLEMTDDDPLETGISLMARPPGKKNSTIHLLSGGEKALTAVALVFAIFQLNPAPFCMLDEVDAPLDDANVGRYANLLQEMSDQVQFIFVTHNKIAMEKAEHLMGVTMHEPGVSRLVSVDVAEAVAMTE